MNVSSDFTEIFRRKQVESYDGHWKNSYVLRRWQGKDNSSSRTGSQSRRSRTSGALLSVPDNSSNERKILESVPGITCLPGRDQVKFVSRMNGDEKAELRHYNNKALDEIVKFCTNFDVLVLDESLCAIHLNVLSEEKIRSFLEHKPRGLEIIMTGHEVSQDLLDLADYATMMMKVKHPYDRKVQAREGIEF